jgi:hypothetical protein
VSEKFQQNFRKTEGFSNELLYKVMITTKAPNGIARLIAQEEIEMRTL